MSQLLLNRDWSGTDTWMGIGLQSPIYWGVRGDTHLFLFPKQCLCLPPYLLLSTFQPGKTWRKITLFSLTEVCFLSPQYKSWGAKVKVKTPSPNWSQPTGSHIRQTTALHTDAMEWVMNVQSPPVSQGGITVDATTVFLFALSGLPSPLQICRALASPPFIQ